MQMQSLSFVQKQQLKMNPQIYQTIRLMELPVFDLRERIEEELERNPALEVMEDRSTVSLDEAEYDYFETSDSGLSRQDMDAASEEHRRFIEGALSRPETLQEHLLWQLQLEPVDDKLRVMAEILIQNLDDDGFHKEPPETLFKMDPIQAHNGIPTVRLKKAMELIRNFDPKGTCTSDYRESLKVQISLMHDAPAGIEKVVDYLDLLERKKISTLAKIINTDKEDVRLFCKRIKELYPFPGRSFASVEVCYVVPDIQIAKNEGEFDIILNDEAIPILGINQFFKKLNGMPDYTAARDFVKGNIREAQVFIQQLNHRNLTLLRVVRALLKFQRSFFVNGPKYLAPLTLEDIARELGVHKSTVSRIASGKYMQTEWGIFRIRYFFSNSTSKNGSGGSLYSKVGVKAIIKEIVVGESKRLSDQAISDLLDQRGIALARRTVAKYRKELGELNKKATGL